ncbi:MAG: hypothetical protein QME64_12195, partial [bacterium]|nr:hypothetical protein [bacterium]
MVSFEFDFKDFIAIIRAYQDEGVLPEIALEKAIHDLGKDYLLQIEKISVSGFPLGSMYASGKFRDKVFVTRSGEETHVRDYTKPRDPRTVKQLAHRERVRLAVSEWKSLPPDQKQYWETEAMQNDKFSGY